MTGNIPFVDFGGSGPLLHFAHANGYPPRSFRRFLAPFTEQYHVLAVEHRPLWSDDEPQQLHTWHTIAADLIRFFEQEGLRDVVGVGHSLGAVVTMIAAVERPALFSKLVLIEPIFLPPDVLRALAEDPEIILSLPLVQATRNRRNRWPNRQTAFAHFRAKSVFGRCADDVLWDYVQYALEETEDGRVGLRYRREWEARVYSRPPLNVWHLLPLVDRPTLGIRGAESDALWPEAWARWQEVQPEASFLEFEEAGHLVPLEQPQRVAAAMRDFLDG